MANQPPHHSWRKRARRAAAGEKQGEQWPDHGREGSCHRLVMEEMMEEEGRRLWCCTILAMVVGDVDIGQGSTYLKYAVKYLI